MEQWNVLPIKIEDMRNNRKINKNQTDIKTKNLDRQNIKFIESPHQKSNNN